MFRHSGGHVTIVPLSTLLNAATFGIAGLVLVAGIGIAATLSGVGFFATGVVKNSRNTDAIESLHVFEWTSQ